MPAPTKPQLAIYAALAVAVLLIGARFLRESGGAGGGVPAAASAADLAPAGASSAPDGLEAGGDAGTATGAGGAGAALATDGGARLVVDVKGAVRRPGVYRLSTGARTYDAVRRAGGLTPRADRIGVNLAARVVDGGEVVVPARVAGGRAVVGASGAGGSSSATGGDDTANAPLALDLNTATAEELEQLDGVGPATAANIVAYRTQYGGFASIDELDEVTGIGEAKLAAIRIQLGQ